MAPGSTAACCTAGGQSTFASNQARAAARRPVGPRVLGLSNGMATENHNWGYKRIQGELLKVGNRVGASCLSRDPPSRSVRAYLRALVTGRYVVLDKSPPKTVAPDVSPAAPVRRASPGAPTTWPDAKGETERILAVRCAT